MNDTYTQETWRRAYAELIAELEKAGIPEEVGRYMAKNLHAERSIRRMTAYMRQMRPASMEQIADEMIAIMEDRNSWIRKKEAEEANAKYTAWLNSDMRGREV